MSQAKAMSQMSFFDFLIPVEMPPRLGEVALWRHRGELESGIAAVREMRAERERRAAEAYERETRNRDPGIRYHTIIVDPILQELRTSSSHAVAFKDELCRYVRERCEGRAPVCYKRAGMSRQEYSHLVNEKYSSVTRETVLRLALGLQLTYDEAERFMRTAGFAFTDSKELDVVFAYCLRHGIYSIFDVNDLLVAFGCAPLEIK